MTGRYVNIYHPGVKRMIQICEVRVYATTRITGGKITFVVICWFPCENLPGEIDRKLFPSPFH